MKNIHRAERNRNKPTASPQQQSRARQAPKPEQGRAPITTESGEWHNPTPKTEERVQSELLREVQSLKSTPRDLPPHHKDHVPLRFPGMFEGWDYEDKDLLQYLCDRLRVFARDICTVLAPAVTDPRDVIDLDHILRIADQHSTQRAEKQDTAGHELALTKVLASFAGIRGFHQGDLNGELLFIAQALYKLRDQISRLFILEGGDTGGDLHRAFYWSELLVIAEAVIYRDRFDTTDRDHGDALTPLERQAEQAAIRFSIHSLKTRARN